MGGKKRSPVQYALEQMGIRTNGDFPQKSVAIYSRTNGDSNKWGTLTTRSLWRTKVGKPGTAGV